MNKKNKRQTKITKLITAALITALFVTSTPELSVKKVSAAKTAAWKVLGEKDLPVDELYGWWYSDDYGNREKDLMIGRKDGKIAWMDGSLQLVKKTKYEQIEYMGEKGSSVDFLVSRQVGHEKEYASFDRTGKITTLGIYKNVEDIGLSETPCLSAEKTNGECGFLVDGKEIGFDKTFTDKPEQAVVRYSFVRIGGKTYYVKQYFETEDVYAEVGEIYDGMSIKRMKETLQAEQCEFIFYDEAGSVVDGSQLIKEWEQLEKEKEEQEKKDAQVIAELRQTAASELPIREYISNTWETGTGKYTVNDVSAYRFGDGYLVYVKADVGFDFEGDELEDPYYFAGFFDREKKLVKFGQVIAGEENGEYWDDGDYGIYLVVRDNDKKIYFYGYDEYAETGNMVKYLYEDTDGIFTDVAYELPSAYPNDVVISGYGETGDVYLAASPTNDFVRITSMYTALKRKNGLKARHVILNEEGGKKEIVFYDSAWKNVIKRIDVSRLPGDIKLCDGIVLGKTCAALYKTGRGQYGLIGMDGNIVVDAEKEGYEKGSVQCGYFEKTCVYFEKDDVKYYYYGGDFTPHTEEEYENWDGDGEGDSDGDNEYGDITYNIDWIEDGSGNTVVCEKVLDSAGNVLASHEVSEEVFENERYENFIYIFPDCKSIVVVDRHWDGKRREDLGESSPQPTSVPTVTPEASPDTSPGAFPSSSPDAGATRSPFPVETPAAVPTSQPVDTAVPIDPGETKSPVEPPTSVPDIHPTQTPPAADDPMQTVPPAPGIPSTQTPSAPDAHPTQIPQMMPSSGPAQTAPAQTAPPLIIEPEDEDEEEDEEEQFKKGDCFMSGNLGYQITKRKGKKGEVAVALVKSNKLKKIVVPKQVKKNGITFSVTSIGKNAFKGCKKVKKLQIKSLNIKSISKKALTGINKRVVIKVPRKKYWAYRIMLRKGGYYTIRK